MKKEFHIITLAVFLLFLALECQAQGVIFNMKDGTTIKVPYEKLDSLVNYGFDENSPNAGGTIVYKKDGTKVNIDFANMESMNVTDKEVKEPLPVQYLLVNGIEIKMIPVEGGRFRYGLIHSADADIDAMDSKSPIINVSSFYISETMVTSDLWYSVYYAQAPSNDWIPISAIAWENAVSFINRLKQVTGKPLRLPTNAEWEFAARGGNLSKGYKYAGSNDWDEVAPKKTSTYSLCRLKMKKPNELGIYDMSGNLGEHVYDDKYYGTGEYYDPVAPWDGSNRYVRGNDPSGQYTNFEVTRTYPSCTECSAGFRIVMEIKK